VNVWVSFVKALAVAEDLVVYPVVVDPLSRMREFWTGELSSRP
jgi:hypothetical protein